MEFKTPDNIKKLEEQIENGYSLKIFKGYVAVDKRGIEKLIDCIYASLPEDVKNAREYLKSKDIHIHATRKQLSSPEEAKGVYRYLEELEAHLFEGIHVIQYSIINMKKIENIINKIYDNIPEEIKKVEELNKQ